MSTHRNTWISFVNTPVGCNPMMTTMPYYDLTFGRALHSQLLPKFITHYLHVRRRQNGASDPILYPSTAASLIFCKLENQCTAYLVGPRAYPYVADYARNGGDFFCVQLTCAGSHALLPFSLEEISGAHFPLEAVFPAWAADLTEIIGNANTIEAKIARFERSMKQRLLFCQNPANNYVNLLNSLNYEDSYQKYLHFINNLNYNHRHVRRLFLQHVGLAPKRFLQIARSKNALRLMTAKPDLKFAEIAYTLDYCDQAHFIKEFKSVYNLTPAQFSKTFLANSSDASRQNTF